MGINWNKADDISYLCGSAEKKVSYCLTSLCLRKFGEGGGEGTGEEVGVINRSEFDWERLWDVWSCCKIWDESLVDWICFVDEFCCISTSSGILSSLLVCTSSDETCFLRCNGKDRSNEGPIVWSIRIGVEGSEDTGEEER